MEGPKSVKHAIRRREIERCAMNGFSAGTKMFYPRSQRILAVVHTGLQHGLRYLKLRKRPTDYTGRYGISEGCM
jgi:hypothetical protein